MVLASISTQFTLDPNTQYATFPHIAPLLGGGFATVWSEENDLVVNVFDADGLPIGTPTVSTGEGDAQPMIVPLSNGGFVIGSQPGEMRARVFDENGDPVDDTFNVNTATVGGQYGLKIVALSGGGFFGFWEDNNGDADGSGVKGQLFDNDGEMVGSEIPINTSTDGNQNSPFAATLSNDNVAVIWNDEVFDGKGDGGLKGQILSPTGAFVGTEFDVSLNDVSDQIIDVTPLDDGDFVVFWAAFYNNEVILKARVFGDDGTPVSGEINVNTSPLGDGDQYNLAPASITALADGSFVAIWGDNNGSGGEGGAVRAHVFDANGQSLGGEKVLATEPQDDLIVDDVEALPGGGFLVHWLTVSPVFRGDIKIGAFTSAGTPTGDPIIIHDDQIAYGIYASIVDNLAVLADGRFVTAWMEGGAADPTGAGLGAAYALFMGFPPEITSDGGGDTATVSAMENDTAVTTVMAIDDNDPSPAFSIAGGADAALFDIDATTGALTFKTAPDFEAPTDTDSDNVYEVVVEASDGFLTDSQAITVEVTNVSGPDIVGTKKKDKLNGTDEDETILGKNGKDKLKGFAGGDLLDGGKKKDKLIGGEDADQFRFSTKLKDKWADKIKDFDIGEDSILLDAGIFKKLSGPGGLTADAFGKGKKAGDADERILHHKKSGSLYYDKDGKGGKDAVKFAKLDKGLKLSEDDFWVV